MSWTDFIPAISIAFLIVLQECESSFDANKIKKGINIDHVVAWSRRLAYTLMYLLALHFFIPMWDVVLSGFMIAMGFAPMFRYRLNFKRGLENMFYISPWSNEYDKIVFKRHLKGKVDQDIIDAIIATGSKSYYSKVPLTVRIRDKEITLIPNDVKDMIHESGKSAMIGEIVIALFILILLIAK